MFLKIKYRIKKINKIPPKGGILLESVPFLLITQVQGLGSVYQQ